MTCPAVELRIDSSNAQESELVALTLPAHFASVVKSILLSALRFPL